MTLTQKTWGVDMPTYTYRCDTCLHEFDTVQGMKDDKLEVCPECIAKPLTRLITPTAVLFKGDGWVDMYRKGKYHEK